MPQSQRVLMVATIPDDERTILCHLQGAGFAPQPRRVDTLDALSAALAEAGWQVAFLAAASGAIDPAEALRRIRAAATPTTVVAICGPADEDRALALLEAGADDYVVMDRPARLGPAVRRLTEGAAERRQYHDLFALAPMPYLVTDADGRVQAANRAALALLGYGDDPPAEIDIISRLGEDSRAVFGAIGKRLSQTGGDERCELRLYTVTGEERFLACSASVVRAQENGEVQLHWALRDVSERALSRRDLEKSELRLRTILDVLPVAVFVADADGRIRMTNRAASRIWGEAPLCDDVADYDRHYKAWWPDGRRLRAHEFGLARVLAGENVPEVEEMEIEATDGARKTILHYARRMLDAHGEPAGAVSVNVDITELRRIEETLRDVLENSRDAIYRRNLQTDRYDYVSPALQELTGLGADDLLAMTHAQVTERVHPEDRAAVVASTQALLASPEPMPTDSGEVRWLTENGAYRWLSDNRRLVRDAEGRPLAFVGTLRDVTVRKEQEEALARRMADLAALYELSQALLGGLDAQQVAQRVCDAAVERFGMRMAWIGLLDRHHGGQGLALAAVAGHDEGFAANLVASLGRDENADRPVMRALRTGRMQTVEDAGNNAQMPEPLRSAAQARGYGSVASLPLAHDGEVEGVLVAFSSQEVVLDPARLQTLQALANLGDLALQNAALQHDLELHTEILEEKVAERTASLRESVALFRAIFDGAASGIALVDDAGRLFAWNAALQALLGLPEERLEQLRLADLLPYRAGRKALSDAWAALAISESPGRRVEVRYLRGDGQERWASVLLSLARDVAGAVRFGLAVVDDITDARRAQEALLHAEKLSATGKLAASFAHEIRNPLQSVIGCLGLASEVYAAGEDPSHYLEVARGELRRANDLVSRLRDLNQRTGPEDRAPVDVHGLLDAVVTLTGVQARHGRVQVLVERADDLPPLTLAADAMQQVFLNLFLNALDAMPEGGALRIRTERAGDEVRIAFSDTGVGIAPEDLGKLFEGFYSTKEEGLGLGLFICQGIVQQHGGQISVESEVGVGSTFTVSLPV